MHTCIKNYMEDTATQTPLRSILWRGEVVGRPPLPSLGRTRITFTSAAARSGQARPGPVDPTLSRFRDATAAPSADWRATSLPPHLRP